MIDNRGGAAGTIGLEIGARATPDGYTLIAGASSSTIVSKFTYGLFAPRGTPRTIVKSLHASVQTALADPEVKRLYANQGLAPLGSTSPEAFGAFVRADYGRLERLVKVAGIKPE